SVSRPGVAPTRNGPVGGWLGNRLVGRALADDRARSPLPHAGRRAGARTANRVRALRQPIQPAGGNTADLYRVETGQGRDRISSWHAMGQALSRCLHPASPRANESSFSGQVRSRTFRATTPGPPPAKLETSGGAVAVGLC